MRQILIDLLWAYKQTIPRGTPYPQIVIDAEDILWAGDRLYRRPGHGIGAAEWIKENSGLGCYFFYVPR
jgi:hypothetical protein